ncbi:MAG: nucleic acid binding ob-fold tRNA/helicase-type [uncultured bacterium]|nr:MAG: nucleic acid binding ob-fold tRNA/helicase-type [uncultured bacterium]
MQRILLIVIIFLLVMGGVSAKFWMGAGKKQGALLPPDGFIVVPEDETYGPARNLFVAMLDKAKHTIDLSMYQLKDQGMIDTLVRAHQRGVRIRIVSEKHPYKHLYNKEKNLHGGVEQLEKLGIPVKGLAPRFSKGNPQAQAHHKILIVDDDCVVVMSGNWDVSTLTATRDFALIINKDKDPLVFQEIKQLFESDWHNKSFEPKNESLIIGPGHQRDQFIKLFSKAKKSIEIYQQSYNDEKIAQALEDICRRGVDVKLLMMPFPFGGQKDGNAGFQDRLIKAGGKVHLVTTRYIHAKVVIIDGKMAYIGSCNFYPPSLDINREVGVLTENASVINRLRDVFKKDWALGKPK